MHLTPSQALAGKPYRHTAIGRERFDAFCTGLTRLLQQASQPESEEHHKKDLADFLQQTWYQPEHYINTKDRTDLVIHLGSDAKTPAAVLIETKAPRNKNEMPQPGKLESKALAELLLYYLRERITGSNLQLRHLVVTDVLHWFVFDAALFEKLFASDKKLVKQFTDFEEKRLAGNKTDFFYNEIARPAIAAVHDQLAFTYLALDDYTAALSATGDKPEKKLADLYKVLSPEHLLKKAFVNDSNSLNKTFYRELLHIIGLAEEKDGGKKVIRRKAADARDEGSLLENTINILRVRSKLQQVPERGSYGETEEEQLFSVALELCISWLNRILFLKLLEGQLRRYHKGETGWDFLAPDRIRDFDELNELFFEVLARPMDDRPASVTARYGQLPYLNSSLFEESALEARTIVLADLKDRLEMPLLPGTVLKDARGKTRTGMQNTLHYLFAFLDAYDFGARDEGVVRDEHKPLINAAVLGLIFEKINGYRDGSFFTPGFITMYMCRETLRRAVIQKFNERYGWNCENLTELHNHIDPKKITEANAVISSLRICDPAVGSGHFLVSALNELIAVKHELGILCDREGKLLRGYTVTVENDELLVLADDVPVVYNPRDAESRRVQEALFAEKHTLIENCLFGVDINPKSVLICRLRLWIELLKNAYYTDKACLRLETLPNIDINIKCGNSLISRYEIRANLDEVFKKEKALLTEYRIAVAAYKDSTSKAAKHKILELIEGFKARLVNRFYAQHPLVGKLSKLRGQLLLIENKAQIGDLFEKLSDKDIATDVKKLKKQIDSTEQEIADIKNDVIYRNAFEWRFEFPEVLDDDGNYVGFDAVIGNPPYIRQEELGELKVFLKSHYKVFAGTADLFVYFVELGMNLLRTAGRFSFIIPNKWMRAGYGKALREHLAGFQLHEIIDFGDLPVFDEATTYPSIMSIDNLPVSHAFRAAALTTLEYPEGLENHLQAQWGEMQMEQLAPEGWNLSNQGIQQIMAKMKKAGKPLGDYVNGKIYRGVLTGLNEAFVIDKATRDKLIAEDPKSEEVIKPFLAGKDIKRYQQPKSERYLLFTRRGIAIENYPAVLKHLKKFKEQLEPQPKDWKGKDWPGRKAGTYKWYEIQDAVDYFQEFEVNTKIILPDISLRCEALIDTTGFYCVNTAYIIPGLAEAELGILNSRLVLFYYSNLTQTIRGGYFRFIRQYLEQIPMPELLAASQKRLNEIVTKIQKAKQKSPTADTAALEAEVDALVYQLYELTPEEIAIVEGSFGK
jgi:hypothetical protein